MTQIYGRFSSPVKYFTKIRNITRQKYLVWTTEIILINNKQHIPPDNYNIVLSPSLVIEQFK